MILTAFVVLLLIAAAIALVVWRGQQTVDPTVREILDACLAAGEINADEYRRRSLLLAAHPTVGTGLRLPVLLVIAGVLLLAVPALLFGWAAPDRWWSHDRMMAAHMGWQTAGRDAGSSPDPVAGAPRLEIAATDLAFDPTSIELVAGEPMNLTLTNRGRVFHDLTIPAAGFRLDADPGEQVTGGLTIDEPGRYEFWCSVPGHASAGMRGTVVVTEGRSR